VAESSQIATRAASRKWLWATPLVIVVLVLVYYLAGMAYVHRIDDDPEFGADIEVPPGASHAVAVAVNLIDREVNVHRWVANDPFFQPGWMLDNMPNYQQGIIYALSRFGVELTDQLARVRGSSEIDPDADRAAGLLKYPGDIWILEWSAVPVQRSSERQYREARDALSHYNARLARGEAVFDRRADNLRTTLERIASDLGSSSAAIAEQIARGSGWLPDVRADDLFYAVKGRAYAYFLLLRGLGADFAQVIAERNLQNVWQQMLETMRQTAVLDPWVVTNGTLDGQFVPNHLAAQGFLLLRARTQLREVSDILLK
jgi:hypothetical protein